MPEWTSLEISTWVGRHLWPLFRIASFLMVVPLFGNQMVPIRVRLGIALLLTLVVVPNLGPLPLIDAISWQSVEMILYQVIVGVGMGFLVDRKSTRLNSSHVRISYAVFCLKKKINTNDSNNSFTE